MKQMETIGAQLIETIAYGDAVGLSVETRSRQEIISRLGRVSGMDTVNYNHHFEGAAAGVWSDDTQLSMAVAEGLTEAGGFDLDIIAQRHVVYLDETPHIEKNGQLQPRGWGHSTIAGIRRVREGYSPEMTGSMEGAGNGTLMKLAPLVYWDHVREVDPLRRDLHTVLLTRMTHAAGEAVVASLVHARVLSTLLSQDLQFSDGHKLRLIEHAMSWARDYEDVYDPRKRVVSKHLNDLLAGPDMTPEHINRTAPGGGFYAPETLAMVYGSYLLESRFPDCVYRAVELGGDTDTTAAIIGPMSLFEHGQVQLPDDIELLDQRNRLQRTSQKLAQAAIQGGV